MCPALTSTYVALTRQQVVDQARQWLDVPWRRVGDTRAGCNCCGFVVGVLRELGMQHIYDAFLPYQGLARPTDPYKMLHLMRRYFEPVPNPMPADVVLFRLDGIYTHVAFVTEDGTLLQTDHKLGRVCEMGFLTRPQFSFQVPGVF